MRELIAAVALLLVLEGLIYGGFPGLAKRLALDVLEIPESALRIGGVVAMAAGVLLYWLAR